MKKAWFAFYALFVSAVCVFGSDDTNKKAGTYTGQFLKMGGTARTGALGGAFVPLADDANAVTMNPGGLGFIVHPEIQAMYAMWLAETYYNYLSYVQPTKLGTFGLCTQYYSGPKITRIINGVAGDKLRSYDVSWNIAYGRSFGDIFSAGLTVKQISSRLMDKSGSANALDLGVLLKTRGNLLSFGLAGENMGGGRLKFINESDPIVYQIKTGFGLDFDLPEHYSEIKLLTEAVFPSDNDPYYVFAMEHWGGGVFALRFGYRVLSSDTKLDPVSNWSGGIGLDIKGFLFDYAYCPKGTLGNIQQISVGMKFKGYAPKKREVDIKMVVEPLVFSPNGDAVRDTIFFTPEFPEIKSLKSWKLTINKQPGGGLTKVFSGRSDIPGVLVWDGTDSNGDVAEEGAYSYDFRVKDSGAKVGKSSGEGILIDLSPPEMVVSVSTDTFTPDGDGIDDAVNFYVEAKDKSSIMRWSATITNSQSKVVKIIKSTQTLPVDVVWDGRDDYYNNIVTNGEYIVDFSAWDEAGNKGSSDIIKVNLKVPPKVIVREVLKEVEVKESDKGLVVNLSSNIMFPSGKSVLKPEAKNALEEVIKLLRAYPENKVLIEGHTDSVGSASSNKILSSARAWSVYSFLVKSGVDPKRLSVKGQGESIPIASNKTKEGRAKNRRVELTILKKGEESSESE